MSEARGWFSMEKTPDASVPPCPENRVPFVDPSAVEEPPHFIEDAGGVVPNPEYAKFVAEREGQVAPCRPEKETYTPGKVGPETATEAWSEQVSLHPCPPTTASADVLEHLRRQQHPGLLESMAPPIAGKIMDPSSGPDKGCEPFKMPPPLAGTILDPSVHRRPDRCEHVGRMEVGEYKLAAPIRCTLPAGHTGEHEYNPQVPDSDPVPRMILPLLTEKPPVTPICGVAALGKPEIFCLLPDGHLGDHRSGMLGWPQSRGDILHPDSPTLKTPAESWQDDPEKVAAVKRAKDEILAAGKAPHGDPQEKLAAALREKSARLPKLVGSTPPVCLHRVVHVTEGFAECDGCKAEMDYDPISRNWVPKVPERSHIKPDQTPCCGKPMDQQRTPIFWNPGNKVVQCHMCGQTYEPEDPWTVHKLSVDTLLECLQRDLDQGSPLVASEKKKAIAWIDSVLRSVGHVPRDLEGETYDTLTSFDPRAPKQALNAEWRINNGQIYNGTLRIARFDFDTAPGVDFSNAVVRQMLWSLNSAYAWKRLADLKDAKGEANRTENNNLRAKLAALDATIHTLHAVCSQLQAQNAEQGKTIWHLQNMPKQVTASDLMSFLIERHGPESEPVALVQTALDGMKCVPIMHETAPKSGLEKPILPPDPSPLCDPRYLLRFALNTVHGLNSGLCVKCGHLFVPQAKDGLWCPNCSFTIEEEVAKAIVGEANPILDECLEAYTLFAVAHAKLKNREEEF